MDGRWLALGLGLSLVGADVAREGSRVRTTLAEVPPDFVYLPRAAVIVRRRKEKPAFVVELLVYDRIGTTVVRPEGFDAGYSRRNGLLYETKMTREAAEERAVEVASRYGLSAWTETSTGRKVLLEETRARLGPVRVLVSPNERSDRRFQLQMFVWGWRTLIVGDESEGRDGFRKRIVLELDARYGDSRRWNTRDFWRFIPTVLPEEAGGSPVRTTLTAPPTPQQRFPVGAKVRFRRPDGATPVDVVRSHFKSSALGSVGEPAVTLKQHSWILASDILEVLSESDVSNEEGSPVRTTLANPELGFVSIPRAVVVLREEKRTGGWYFALEVEIRDKAGNKLHLYDPDRRRRGLEMTALPWGDTGPIPDTVPGRMAVFERAMKRAHEVADAYDLAIRDETLGVLTPRTGTPRFGPLRVTPDKDAPGHHVLQVLVRRPKLGDLWVNLLQSQNTSINEDGLEGFLRRAAAALDLRKPGVAADHVWEHLPVVGSPKGSPVRTSLARPRERYVLREVQAFWMDQNVLLNATKFVVYDRDLRIVARTFTDGLVTARRWAKSGPALSMLQDLQAGLVFSTTKALDKLPQDEARLVWYDARAEEADVAAGPHGSGVRTTLQLPDADRRLADAVYASNVLQSRRPGKPIVRPGDAASILRWLRWNDPNGDYEDELANNLDDAQRTLVEAWPEDELEDLLKEPRFVEKKGSLVRTQLGRPAWFSVLEAYAAKHPEIPPHMLLEPVQNPSVEEAGLLRSDGLVGWPTFPEHRLLYQLIDLRRYGSSYLRDRWLASEEEKRTPWRLYLADYDDWSVERRFATKAEAAAVIAKLQAEPVSSRLLTSLQLRTL